MSIVASAGYTQYSSVLITPLFGDRLIARAYCEFVAGDITNTDYNGDITKHGDRITYFIEPEVEVHDYQKNARLQPQELESETVTMVIDRAKYYNVKLDRVDEKQIQFIDKWVEAFLQRASYNVKLQIDPDVLMRMALQTAPFNKGMNAGKQSQSQQLGEVGNPVADHGRERHRSADPLAHRVARGVPLAGRPDVHRPAGSRRSRIDGFGPESGIPHRYGAVADPERQVPDAGHGLYAVFQQQRAERAGRRNEHERVLGRRRQQEGNRVRPAA
ncbi:hypothetical protein KEH56_36590 [Burkholderia cenocepacia]|uniref:hypothetical protein n=1 Tax=Burkholderia cenocepacia TaxID=95486 RepID=UPI001BAC053F|nr:hypothetical protein [Burkholderia cenocepacia]QUN44691.1 hypothetical protein KEH56_36590 [Burkholderia cenocepacia]